MGNGDDMKQFVSYTLGLTVIAVAVLLPAFMLLGVVAYLWQGSGGLLLALLLASVAVAIYVSMQKHLDAELQNNLEADLRGKDAVINGKRYLGVNATIINRNITKSNKELIAKWTCKTSKGAVFFYVAEVYRHQIHTSELQATRQYSVQAQSAFGAPEIA